MKPRITFFMPSLRFGGAEKNLVYILGNLPEESCPTLLLCKKEGELLSRLSGRVEVLNIGTVNTFFVLLRVFKYFKQKKPDIFVSTFPRFNIINLMAYVLSGRHGKFVAIEQTTPSKVYATACGISHQISARFFLPYLIRIIYLFSNKVIAVSEVVKKDLKEKIGLKKEVEVIYNPVVSEDLSVLMNETVGHSWFLKKNLPIIISSGRIVGAKDYITLVKAFSLVLKKMPVRLVIIGEGEEKERIQELTKDLKISESVLFLPFQRNHYKYLSKADVFVSSSKREGFSNTIVEAMFCGLPVVSTASEGPSEIITDKKNGILVPVGDKNTLAEKIIEVLQSKELSSRISEAGKERSLEFSVEKSVGNYKKVFKEMLNAK